MQTLDEAERDKIEELMVRHGFTDLPLKGAMSAGAHAQ